MIDYSFDPRIHTAPGDALSRANFFSETFNRYLKKLILMNEMDTITDICMTEPSLEEECRIMDVLKKNNRIYISNKPLLPNYQTAHLNSDVLRNMSTLTRIRMALKVLDILRELEQERIFPGAINLNAVVYDMSFRYPNIYLGSVTKYQVGCLRQLFPVEGYDPNVDLPLYFDSRMQHIANARLVISILTPCGDDLQIMKRDDPLLLFLRLADDYSPDELGRAIVAHLDVSWLKTGLTKEEHEELLRQFHSEYPDVVPVTLQDVEHYRVSLEEKEAATTSAELEPEPQSPMQENPDSVRQNETAFSSAMNKVFQFVGFPKGGREQTEETLLEGSGEPAHSRRRKDTAKPTDIVSGKLGMCFIVPPFTQTEETHQFREQIALVQSSAAVALGSRSKDLEVAYFWANSPEDVHDLYGRSSHTDFMPLDIAYSPPILPGKNKDASFIKQAYVSSDTLALQTGMNRVLSVVLLPGADKSDAGWVAERARKETDDRNRLLLIHADEAWKAGINTDDPNSLQMLPEKIREAFAN